MYLYSDSATFWGLKLTSLSSTYSHAFTSPGRSLFHRKRCPLTHCSGWAPPELTTRCTYTDLQSAQRDSLDHGIPGREVKVWSHCLAGTNIFCVVFYSCAGQELWDSVVLLPVPAAASIHPEEQNGQHSWSLGFCKRQRLLHLTMLWFQTEIRMSR